MTISGWMTLSVTLGAAVLCAGSQAQTTIPKSQGTTLTGTAVTLPDALQGKVGVLVVGFSHGSQEHVASWGRLLAADYSKAPEVVYFEIPILAGAPKMLRGMIAKSIGKSMPEAERSHLLPLMEGEPATSSPTMPTFCWSTLRARCVGRPRVTRPTRPTSNSRRIWVF
jgi:hypothetical protein